MKILVFSDTHGRTEKAWEIMCTVEHDMVLHLGDCVADVRELSALMPEENIRYVAGNDIFDVMSREQTRQVFMAGGAVIFMTHGHEYSVNGPLFRLIEAAQGCGAAAALYGHTHVPHIEKRGALTLFNPGSLSRGRGTFGNSYGILEIEGGEVKCRIEYI